MTQSGSSARFGGLVLALAVSGLTLAACSKKDDSADSTVVTTSTTTPAADGGAPAASTTTTAAGPAPAADNTDTVSGAKFASFTGDPVKGKADFTTCQTCHSIEAGKNMIGPSLHGVVGRPAGSIAGYAYSSANKNSGITWTDAKLFQYLEAPQRVVPGTKMTFPGWSDPQKRADVIAYLKSNS